MAYTAIDDPSAHFITNIFTGNGATGQTITTGFQPDLVWVRNRAEASGGSIYNSTVGHTLFLQSTNSNGDASDSTDDFTAFISTGFTVDNDSNLTNSDGVAMVSWSWKANGGSRTTNAEDGDNPAGGYQANTTAGFSIVDYVGTGGAGTKAHGLGAIPEVVIIKNRDRSAQWAVYHKDIGATKFLELSTTAAEGTDAMFNDTAPTSTVFSVGGSSNTTNADGENLMAYCFKAIQGYSKFGSYTGNGDADGTFIYLGFKPAFVIVKCTSDAGDYWWTADNKRDVDNPVAAGIKANATDAENTNLFFIDFLSNGFKAVDGGGQNISGRDYIYIAFAEQPFVTSGGVPCTAR